MWIQLAKPLIFQLPRTPGMSEHLIRRESRVVKGYKQREKFLCSCDLIFVVSFLLVIVVSNCLFGSFLPYNERLSSQLSFRLCILCFLYILCILYVLFPECDLWGNTAIASQDNTAMAALPFLPWRYYPLTSIGIKLALMTTFLTRFWILLKKKFVFIATESLLNWNLV